MKKTNFKKSECTFCKEQYNQCRFNYWKQIYCSDKCKSLAWYCNNREKELERIRLSRLKFIDKRRQYDKDYYQQNKELIKKKKVNDYYKNYKKWTARSLSRKVKLDNFCKLCNSSSRLERHHPDYNKPLDIITLCKPCHSKLHGGGQIKKEI